MDTRGATLALRANILAFYQDLGRPLDTKSHKNEWRDLQRNLDDFKRQTGPAALPGDL